MLIYTKSEKTMGVDLNFFASKEAYPVVRQLEKITVKKAKAKVVKCAKNKSWVPRNPPWSLKYFKSVHFQNFLGANSPGSSLTCIYKLILAIISFSTL